MEIYATAYDVIGIFGMNYDRVSVRNLAFFFEMRTGDVSPLVAPIRRTKDAKQQVLAAACFILCKRIKNLWIR